MVELLGFRILDCSKSEYISDLMKQFEGGEKKVIVSGNPEVLNNGLKIRELSILYNESDIIPDGIGIIIGGKITRQRFREKIAGIELMEDILILSGERKIKVYMLGSEEWVVKKAVNECSQNFGVLMAGYHNGYFDLESCEAIIREINDSGAEILFIGMGSPRQELFIARYRHMLKCRIQMGVGGSFDILAGKLKRAPRWMIRTGFEWLYRVINEPARIVRLTSIPNFLIKVVRNRGNKEGR